MKIGDLAKRINTPTTTIRHWSKEFGEFLSDSAAGRLKGAHRNYSDEDGKVLATIAQLRAQGLTHDHIVESLQSGNTAVLPDEPDADEEEVRQSIRLIPLPQLERALDQVKVMQGEIERLLTERDQAMVSRNDADAKIAELREELGRAKGKVTGFIVVGVVLGIVAVIALILFLVLLVRVLPAV